MKTNNVHFQFVFEGFFIAGSSELLNLKGNDNLYLCIIEPGIENSKIHQRKERLLLLESNGV
jgi:hypothetical protein